MTDKYELFRLFLVDLCAAFFADRSMKPSPRMAVAKAKHSRRTNPDPQAMIPVSRWTTDITDERTKSQHRPLSNYYHQLVNQHTFRQN